MSNKAFCPSCKRDVDFQTASGSSVCPECGAAFELGPSPSRITRVTFPMLMAAFAWMFAPAIIALLSYLIFKQNGARNFDSVFGRSQMSPLAIVWTIAAIINSCVACMWLARRVTKRAALWITVGLVLGGGVFLCNAAIALFGGCAVLGV